MNAPLVAALHARRPRIRAHWETLLRTEPIRSPLAHPDTLVHLIDWTLDELFSALANPHARERIAGTHGAAAESPHCPCGRNPLLAHFAAGAQAMREALVLAQAAAAPLDPLERDASLEELNLVLRHVSRREIEAFCGVCRQGGLPSAPPPAQEAAATV